MCYSESQNPEMSFRPGRKAPRLLCHCVFGPMSSCLQELWEVGQWAETSARRDNTAFQSWRVPGEERERDGTVLGRKALWPYRLDGLSWKTAGSRHQAGEQREEFGEGVLEREREREGFGVSRRCLAVSVKTIKLLKSRWMPRSRDERDETGALPLQATESLLGGGGGGLFQQNP